MKTDGKWRCRAQLSNQREYCSSGFFFAFLPILPHLLLEKRVFLPVKICVPRKITLGCAPAPGLNVWVALLQLVEKTIVKLLSVDLSMISITSTLSICSYKLAACGEQIHHTYQKATLCGNVKGTRSSPRWAENTSYG